MKEQEIRIVVVEDMADYIDVIEMLLKEVAPWVKVAGKASTLTEAERLISEIRPDALLLDIQFESEGKTGFDLLDVLHSRNNFNFQIIVITAHTEQQYYAKAFEYNALHFLEKPISKSKLADAMKRVRDSVLVSKIDALASMVESNIARYNSDPAPFKITVNGLRFNEIIDVNNIIWIQADGRRSVIYLNNEKTILSTDSIGFFENQLSCCPNFIRLNRSEVINKNYIERYSRKERLIVVSGKNPNHYASKDKFLMFIQSISPDNA